MKYYDRLIKRFNFFDSFKAAKFVNLITLE